MLHGKVHLDSVVVGSIPGTTLVLEISAGASHSSRSRMLEVAAVVRVADLISWRKASSENALRNSAAGASPARGGLWLQSASKLKSPVKHARVKKMFHLRNFVK